VVDGPILGYAVSAAADADTFVVVQLERCGMLLPIKHTVITAEDTANQADIDTQLGFVPNSVVSAQIENTSNVRRNPAGAVTLLTAANAGKVRVVDANLAVNEVIHLLVAI
jgi:hypothetical protein